MKIDKTIMTDKNTVKVFDGIAGSGKSSMIDAWLKSNGVEYMRLTSTNRLKRDAEARYGVQTKTIAGGLFKTTFEEGFFAEQKDPDIKTIVIDEILQTSPRVFDWINSHRGEYNIIVCTDKMQMLSPIGEDNMRRKYEEFCVNKFVKVIPCMETLRPTNEITQNLYYYAYKNSDSLHYGTFGYLKKFLTRHGQYKSLEYNPRNVYITHTKLIEQKLYDDWDLRHNYNNPLIPKGRISSDNSGKISTQYPILPQIEAEGVAIGYYQLENIGTVTRYQGSEVQPEQVCCYLIEKGSHPNNREIYTLITRLKDIRSLVIIEMDVLKDDKDPEKFLGKPVLKKEFYHLTEEEKAGKDPKDLTRQEIKNKLRNLNYENKDHNYIGIIDGGEVLRGSDFTPYKIDRTTISIRNIMDKTPEAKLTKPNKLAKRLDEIGRRHGLEEIDLPYNMDYNENKEEYEYALDLYSSYPNCLMCGDIPDGRTFSTDRGDVNFYITTNGRYGKPGTIITEKLHNVLSEDPYYFDEFVGSFERLKDVKQFAALREKCYKSVEWKQKIKKVKWGILSRKYLEPLYDGNMNIKGYQINKDNTYEITMCAILSEQAYLLARIKEITMGAIQKGNTRIDEVHFNYDGDIKQLGDILSWGVIPGYDFRIYRIKDGKDKPLYKTYDDLKTNKVLKAERDKGRRRSGTHKKHTGAGE